MSAIGNDQLDFYARDLGPSQAVALSVASASSGRLQPRRYLVQFIDIAANRVWVRATPFNAAPTPATAAAPSTPFEAAGQRSFEINVRPGHNDQISALLSAGTGTMIITPLSRVAKV